jgi:DNA-directed RNA polymerase specialized sigma24 family protein
MQKPIYSLPPPQPDPSTLPSADLLRQCGEHLGDRALWAAFVKRFQPAIAKYLRRAIALRGGTGGRTELIHDLAQEVYLRLVRNSGTPLRGFRGTNEFSVKAFLARVCWRVVSDYFRQHEGITQCGPDADAAQLPGKGIDVLAILRWIDVKRIVESDPDRPNTDRNALIFKLHYIDGFLAKEIASFPGFSLTESGVTTILTRLRRKIIASATDLTN